MFIEDIKMLEDKHGIRIFPIVETFADGITPGLRLAPLDRGDVSEIQL